MRRISSAPRTESASIAVRVVPRAGRCGVAGKRGDAYLVRVNAAPVEGAANEELISVLAAALDVPRRAIVLASGERSRQKRVVVTGIDQATAESRLER